MKEDFNLDNNIKDLVNKNEVLPESVKAKTQLAYKEVMSMNIHNKKAAKKKCLIAASLLAISAISLQTPLLAGIKDLFFGGNYKGVESAIENGDLQSLEGIESESHGIKLEAIGALIDPTIIHLRLKLTAQDAKMFKNFTYTQHTSRFIDQFTILDDQGRILQAIDEEGTYTVPIKDASGKETWLVSSSAEQVNTTSLDKGEIYIDMMLNSSEGNYKGLKELTLTTNKLGDFKGDWILQIPFTSEMIEDKEIAYEVSHPNAKINIISAVAMKTGIKIDCIINAPVDEDVINSKIISANGATYTSGRSAWMENTPSGERVVLTFEVLEKDLEDSFTLYLPTLEGRQESVTLTKVIQ